MERQIVISTRQNELDAPSAETSGIAEHREAFHATVADELRQHMPGFSPIQQEILEEKFFKAS
jgi:hypothetical protein